MCVLPTTHKMDVHTKYIYIYTHCVCIYKDIYGFVFHIYACILNGIIAIPLQISKFHSMTCNGDLCKMVYTDLFRSF